MCKGFKNPCRQCGYQTTAKGSLAKHERAVHEGFKFYIIESPYIILFHRAFQCNTEKTCIKVVTHYQGFEWWRILMVECVTVFWSHKVENSIGGLCNQKMVTHSTIRILHHSNPWECVTTFPCSLPRLHTRNLCKLQVFEMVGISAHYNTLPYYTP